MGWVSVVLGAMVLAGAGPTTRPTSRGAYAPTSSYEKREVMGWVVYVSKDLREGEPEVMERALELLRGKLFEVSRVLPPNAVKVLRGVPIWVEREDGEFVGGCYHPSGEWLADHGFNPEKAGSVEFGCARNLLAWSKEQPAMVLHELAHAYHHRVLGYSNKPIKDAYENAKEKKLYEAVLRANGRVERAYGMNNDQEYFAESTEAYFGTNDFYPFVRAELEKHDPQIVGVLREVWGVK